MANNYENLVAEKEAPVDTEDAVICKLDRMAEQQKHREFVAFVEKTDWSEYSAAVLRRVLDVALLFEMVPLSRELAQKGAELFPYEEQFQRAARVLAPPRIIGTRPGKKRNIKTSHEWFNKNASQYRGQWVAVHKGKFLAAAQTYDEMNKNIDKKIPSDEILVVKVLGS